MTRVAEFSRGILPWLSCLVFLAATQQARAAADQYSVRQIFEAWKARQSKFQSARFEFSEVMVYPKGTLSFGKGHGRKGPTKDAPERDATIDRDIILLLGRDGNLRYEVRGNA